MIVGGWTTHLKNMLVKLDHFPNSWGENKTYLKPPPRKSPLLFLCFFCWRWIETLKQRGGHVSADLVSEICIFCLVLWCFLFWMRCTHVGAFQKRSVTLFLRGSVFLLVGCGVSWSFESPISPTKPLWSKSKKVSLEGRLSPGFVSWKCLVEEWSLRQKNSKTIVFGIPEIFQFCQTSAKHSRNFKMEPSYNPYKWPLK